MATALMVFYQLVTLLGFVAVGWVLTKSGKLPDDKPLGSLVANVALPALVIRFLQMPHAADMLMDICIAAVGYAVALAAAALVGLILGRACRQSAGVTGTWTACIVFPNSIFMGMPIKYALFGEQALPLLAGIMLVFNLGSFVFGAWLLSLESTQKKRPTMRKLMLQPAVVGGFVGLALLLLQLSLPAPALRTVDMLAATATPLAMVIIGSQLAGCSLRATFWDAKVYLVSLARLIPAGLAAHFLLRLFISDPVMLGVLTIAACMPGAATIPVIADQQGGDALFCSKMTLVSTLLCVVTAPILVSLLLG